MADKYRVAVIGRTGRGDYGHALDTMWLGVPRAEVVAVSDPDKAGCAEAARRLNISQTFGDYREMLDKTKPQVVSIAARWLDCHHEMVLACAERGIHIYCEKPLCRNLAEADEMVAACERSHVKLALAHQTRYSPKLPVVKKLLDDGVIGKVLEFRGRGKEDQRGGAEDLWVLGSHVMDLICYFGGEPQWCLGTVTVDGRGIEKSDVVDGPEGIGPLAGDRVDAMYGMSGGATAFFGSRRNGMGRPSRFGLQIFGSNGVIEILTSYLPSVKLLVDGGWSPLRGKKKWQDVSSAGVDQPEPLEVKDQQAAGNIAGANDLLDAIEQDREPVASIYTGRAAVEMIVAPFESQRTASRVAMPLATRQNPLTLL
jgi:predicted dehydrogenase